MPTPLFIATRYGHPGYLKMLACTDSTIRRGADDGGEMGAFHFRARPATRVRPHDPPRRIHARGPRHCTDLPDLALDLSAKFPPS